MRISDWSSDVCSSDLTPSSSSSLRIWVESVGWLTKHAAAARPKCRCSARATKYLRSRRFMGFLRFVLPVVVSGGFGLGLGRLRRAAGPRSEEHTSELQSLMRISYAVFCLKKKNKTK